MRDYHSQPIFIVIMALGGGLKGVTSFINNEKRTPKWKMKSVMQPTLSHGGFIAVSFSRKRLLLELNAKP